MSSSLSVLLHPHTANAAINAATASNLLITSSFH
jgi:hypothetical protein